jgi:hypothetical protein
MRGGAVELLHGALTVLVAVGLTMWVVGVPSGILAIYCVIALPLGVLLER